MRWRVGSGGAIAANFLGFLNVVFTNLRRPSGQRSLHSRYRLRFGDHYQAYFRCLAPGTFRCRSDARPYPVQILGYPGEITHFHMNQSPDTRSTLGEK
jgi:hypothetical protein